MAEFEKAKSLFKAGKFSESLEIFHQLVNKHPEEMEYISYRARVFSRLGDYQRSLEDFDRLISITPYDTTHISDRAVVLHLLNRNEEAISELDRALNLDPNNPYRYASRAYLKDRMGDFHGAIADYEKAIALDPEDAISYNNKGLVEEKLGYISRSKKSFKQSDDLIGYKPYEQKNGAVSGDDQSAANLPPIAPAYIEAGKARKITFASFLTLLNSLVTDGQVRKDFLKFIKNKFKGA